MDTIVWNVSDFMVNGVLALIMLGIGLSLTVNDFRNLFRQPRSLITALLIQLFVLPVAAFLIASLSPLTPAMKAGLVLVSLCASGASSNLITHLFSGNVALAISMTTINSLLTLISIPLLSNLALKLFLGQGSDISLPVGQTIFQIVVVTLVPASCGIAIRHYKTKAALRLEKPLKILMPLLLGAVFSIKIFSGEKIGGTGITTAEVLSLFPYMLILNAAALLLGFYGARMVRLPFRDQFTVSIEVGLHNTALALLIAGTILKLPEMEKPALVYAMFSFFTTVLFVWLIRLRNKKELPHTGH